VNEEFPYDSSRRPPAPVIPLRLKRTGAEPSVVISALVDSGADVTVVPEQTARDLRLPVVRKIYISGVGGFKRPAIVSVADVEIAGRREIADAVVFGNEALIGRDLLNRWVTTLDGPQQRLRVEAPRPKPKAR
jgi:predicted aspartyl protease